jgi:hypothetical protein
MTAEIRHPELVEGSVQPAFFPSVILSLSKDLFHPTKPFLERSETLPPRQKMPSSLFSSKPALTLYHPPETLTLAYVNRAEKNNHEHAIVVGSWLGDG